MKALVGAFNQEKALVGAFSVIVKTGCSTDGSICGTSKGRRDLSKLNVAFSIYRTSYKSFTNIHLLTLIELIYQINF